MKYMTWGKPNDKSLSSNLRHWIIKPRNVSKAHMMVGIGSAEELESARVLGKFSQAASSCIWEPGLFFVHWLFRKCFWCCLWPWGCWCFALLVLLRSARFLSPRLLGSQAVPPWTGGLRFQAPLWQGRLGLWAAVTAAVQFPVATSTAVPRGLESHASPLLL